MRKIMVLFMMIISISIVGCSGILENKRGFNIEYEELTEEQSQLLTLTGNRVQKYNLNNLPKNKEYELGLVYEVYENDKKVKEEEIIGLSYDATIEGKEDTELAINIQDNKIRCMMSNAYTSYDIEEDIAQCSYTYLYNDISISANDEIYLFHGSKAENSFSPTVGKASEEEIKHTIEKSEISIFIKLVYKDI